MSAEIVVVCINKALISKTFQPQLDQSVPSETSAPSIPLPKLGVKSNIENPASFRHLRDWFLANIHYPFPTPEEKQELAEAKDLKLKSVNLW